MPAPHSRRPSAKKPLLPTTGAFWSEADLIRRLLHALDIAEQALERLANNGYTDAQEPSFTIQPEKVISETGFFLMAAAAVNHIPVVNTRVQALAHQLAPYARSSRMRLGVCLEPSLALDYAQAHICLNYLGLPDASFDTLLRQSQASQAFGARERPPHRVLEQRWLLHLWDDDAVRPPAPKSALNAPTDLLAGSRDDVYAFTHALMYMAYNNESFPPRLPRSRAVIMAEAEALLARCLAEQDYDLGGEVLLAWPLTGAPWSPAAIFALRVLAQAEDAVGFLPSPATRLQRLSELQGAERSRYLLASAYHTVYVMGLLSAAALRPSALPPAAIPTRRVTAGAAAAILPLVGDNRQEHWRDELRRLSLPEQDTLAGLWLQIGLWRQSQRRDFDAVFKLLQIGNQYGLTSTPMAIQAAEMLERLQLFAHP